MSKTEPKEIEWVGSARKDMQKMPLPVRRTFGYALYAAQMGLSPPEAKALKGFGGAGVLELVEDYRGGTYRAVYTARFTTAIYVLHVFQKKAKRGIATPKQEMDMIRERLKRAESIHAGKNKDI